jgi:hypothetical protein
MEVPADLTEITADLTEITADLTEITADLTEITADLTEITADLTEITADLTKIPAAPRIGRFDATVITAADPPRAADVPPRMRTCPSTTAASSA